MNTSVWLAHGQCFSTPEILLLLLPLRCTQRDTYLKLKMCMLWAWGLSLSFVILHIYLKQLLEEQEWQQHYFFLKWPDLGGASATDLCEICYNNNLVLSFHLSDRLCCCNKIHQDPFYKFFSKWKEPCHGLSIFKTWT